METLEEQIVLKPQVKISNTERESGIELLRIIAIIFIVLYHSVALPVMTDSYYESVLRTLAYQNGKLGVNIFIIISAYFMIDKHITIKHILKIYLPALFYSLLFYFFSVQKGLIAFDFKQFVTFLFPIYFCKWWYVSCYLILMLLTPILNMFIKSLTKKKHLIICLSLIFFETILAYFKQILTGEFFGIPYFNELFIFIILYFIGSYIKLHSVDLNSFLLIIISLLLFVIFKIFLPLFGLQDEALYMNSVGNMILSISLFLIFKKIKFKSKFINTISSTTYGIYLIHFHDIFRWFIWTYAYKIAIKYFSHYALVYIFSVVIVLGFCFAIDLLRQLTIHKFALKLIDKILNKVKNKKSDLKNFIKET